VVFATTTRSVSVAATIAVLIAKAFRMNP
jgi:hypothetical protein